MFSVFLTESRKFNVKKITKYIVLKKNYRFILLDISLIMNLKNNFNSYTHD